MTMRPSLQSVAARRHHVPVFVLDHDLLREAATKLSGRPMQLESEFDEEPKRTCCRGGWCVTSIAGAVHQGSSDSGFELGGVPLHTRG